MSRTHSRADIYLGDALTWTEAIITEQTSISKLTVKARHESHPSAYRTVLTLHDVAYVGENQGAQRWTGTDDEGTEVTLTRVPRRSSGCSSCG